MECALRAVRRRLTTGSAGLALLFVALLTGCSSGGGGTSASSAWHGDTLAPPITLTAASGTATFSSSAGTNTSLASQQKGRLMLLYFGYTHCPDICPTTMADLASALRELPVAVQRSTQVVFVTADPARDTPPVMKAWLRNFDSGVALPFIGLTGPVTQIDNVAKSVGIALEPPVKQPNGSITVQHGAETLAFIDGEASLVWTSDTPVTDYAADIRRLAAKVSSA